MWQGMRMGPLNCSCVRWRELNLSTFNCELREAFRSLNKTSIDIHS